MKRWKETLCLPRTDFPMRAGLAKQEPRWLEFWEGMDLYGARRRARQGAERWVLHDGPPYANGDIHVGTALNKILKDMVCRYAWQAGLDTPYLPGWDCHGLPIEHKVLEELGGSIPEGMAVTEVRSRCHDLAMGFMDAQRGQFWRLGVLGEWDAPYLTVSPEYEAAVLECWRGLVEAGLVERARKSVHWSWAAKSALAEAELEYRDREDPSIAVAFAAVPGTLPDGFGDEAALAIWTTTPWTLPANVAVAVDPEAEYGLYEVGGRRVVLARARAEAWTERLGLGEPVALAKGADLLSVRYRLPCLPGEGVVLAAGHVSMEEGTGLVHTAPGHGADDFALGKAAGLPVPCPVDEEGRFLPAAGLAEELGVPEGDLPERLASLAGVNVFAANAPIVGWLEEEGSLLHHEPVSHSYPHCWRTKEPVIFRATPQWFVKMDASPGGEGPTLRERVLAAIERAEWYPEWGGRRLASMVENRPDWCVSRQRHWGIAIPALEDLATGEVLSTGEVAAAARDAVAERGSGVWFDEGVPTSEIVPEEALPQGWRGRNLARRKDIFDVWFESGSSHRAVLMPRDDLGCPAGMYLEGDDQHRGWFQLSAILGVAGTGDLPYRSCLTHAFVVDEAGRKMSKSLGNVVDPMEVAATTGADVLRLWAVSADFTVPIGVSGQVLSTVGQRYRKARNTLRFLLGVLDGFGPGERVEPAHMRPYDRWALAALAHHDSEWRSRRDAHDLQGLAGEITLFMGALSSGYLDAVKDRLYADAPDGLARRAARTVCSHLLERLLVWLAPVLPFTCEEAWQAWEGRPQGATSVHLAELLPVPLEWEEPGPQGAVHALMPVLDEARRALEKAKDAGAVTAPLEASLTLFLDDDLLAAARALPDDLEEVFGVSAVEALPFDRFRDDVVPFLGRGEGMAVGAELAPAEKCPRCWKRKRAPGDALCPRCDAVAGEEE